MLNWLLHHRRTLNSPYCNILVNRISDASLLASGAASLSRLIVGLAFVDDKAREVTRRKRWPFHCEGSHATV
jgi:hypothetical protein